MKPDNIVILIQDDDPKTAVAKLADLGLAREINPDGPSTVSSHGTREYYAPEQFVVNSHLGKNFSFPADVWGLGMSIYQLLDTEGKRPFSDEWYSQ